MSHGEDIPANFRDIEVLRNQVTEALNNFAKNTASRFTEIEERLEEADKVVSALAMGYAEMAVILDAVIAHVGTKSPDERKAFLESIESGRKQMLGVFSEYANVVERTDPRTASTIQDMVKEQQTPTSD